MHLVKITKMPRNVMTLLKGLMGSNGKRIVHASFRKVVAFDLLFLMLGLAIGAGISTAFMTGDIEKIIPRWEIYAGHSM